MVLNGNMRKPVIVTSIQPPAFCVCARRTV